MGYAVSLATGRLLFSMQINNKKSHVY